MGCRASHWETAGHVIQEQGRCARRLFVAGDAPASERDVPFLISLVPRLLACPGVPAGRRGSAGADVGVFTCPYFAGVPIPSSKNHFTQYGRLQPIHRCSLPGEQSQRRTFWATGRLQACTVASHRLQSTAQPSDGVCFLQDCSCSGLRRLFHSCRPDQRDGVQPPFRGGSKAGDDAPSTRAACSIGSPIHRRADGRASKVRAIAPCSYVFRTTKGAVLQPIGSHPTERAADPKHHATITVLFLRHI